MKDSLIVLGIFVGGCLLGVLGYFPLDLKTGNLSIYILYALMFQIGISIGSNKELKSMISQLRLKFLLIPLATISGTLLFSAITLVGVLKVILQENGMVKYLQFKKNVQSID